MRTEYCFDSKTLPRLTGTSNRPAVRAGAYSGRASSQQMWDGDNTAQMEQPVRGPGRGRGGAGRGEGRRPPAQGETPTYPTSSSQGGRSSRGRGSSSAGRNGEGFNRASGRGSGRGLDDGDRRVGMSGRGSQGFNAPRGPAPGARAASTLAPIASVPVNSDAPAPSGKKLDLSVNRFDDLPISENGKRALREMGFECQTTVQAATLPVILQVRLFPD